MNIRLQRAKPKQHYWILLLFILGSEAVGLSGTVFTLSAIPTWYAGLVKPFFSPPNWLFGPVWTLLYTLIGTSAYLIWAKYRFTPKSRIFWRVFAAQLLLNFFWTPLFFGLKWTGLAYLEIVAMWVYIWLTIRQAKKLIPLASFLLYPYLAWVTFASFLNLAIWFLN